MSECANSPELESLRQERDQLRSSLAAERERADRAEHRLGLFKAEAEAAHKEKNEKHIAMNDARAELAEVKRDRESLWKCNAGLRTAQDERDAARAEAALSKQETHAVEHMLVRRLGGTVEGAPTSTVNYLQRVDELREIERVSDALRARVAELEKSAHESSAQEGKLAHMLNQAQSRVAVLEGLLKEIRSYMHVSCSFDCMTVHFTQPHVDRIDAALAGGEVPHGKLDDAGSGASRCWTGASDSKQNPDGTYSDAEAM